MEEATSAIAASLLAYKLPHTLQAQICGRLLMGPFPITEEMYARLCVLGCALVFHYGRENDKLVASAYRGAGYRPSVGFASLHSAQHECRYDNACEILHKGKGCFENYLHGIPIIARSCVRDVSLLYILTFLLSVLRSKPKYPQLRAVTRSCSFYMTTFMSLRALSCALSQLCRKKPDIMNKPWFCNGLLPLILSTVMYGIKLEDRNRQKQIATFCSASGLVTALQAYGVLPDKAFVPLTACALFNILQNIRKKK
eukprot:m.10024 g.10024  ORF g.10024 m.10024 type:complete len:255 (-) comp4184_c0_seq2:50-814(-)